MRIVFGAGTGPPKIGRMGALPALGATIGAGPAANYLPGFRAHLGPVGEVP